MFKRGLISIIIPIFNIQDYLDECLESVTKQNYKNIEIILINDGSTDASAEICDIWKEKDKRIRVVHCINSGVSAARNIGLENSKGEYIYFCDGDDIVSSNILVHLSMLINEYKTQMSVCSYREFINKNEIKIDVEYRDTIIELHEKIDKSTYKNIIENERYSGYLWNKLFLHKIIFDNNIKFDLEINVLEDELFVLQYIAKCISIVFSEKSLYYYRIRSGSMVNLMNSDKYFSSMLGREKIYLFFLEHKIDYYSFKTWNSLINYYAYLFKNLLQLNDVDKKKWALEIVKGYNKYKDDYKLKVSGNKQKIYILIMLICIPIIKLWNRGKIDEM